jgi:hypothetical protein
MGSIYRGTWATLVALSGSSANSGLDWINPKTPSIPQTISDKVIWVLCPSCWLLTANWQALMGEERMDTSRRATISSMSLFHPTPSLLWVQSGAVLQDNSRTNTPCPQLGKQTKTYFAVRQKSSGLGVTWCLPRLFSQRKYRRRYQSYLVWRLHSRIPFKKPYKWLRYL